MKIPAALLAVMFSFSAVAAENGDKTTPAAAQEGQDGKTGKTVIIDGRKFFPLTNARHFSGSAKPMPPRVPLRQTGHFTAVHSELHKTPLPAVKPSEDNTQTKEATPPPSTASDVLSIFAPEEKAAPSIPTKQ